MTITIEMTPELERQLRQAAAQAGLTPDTYIVKALREHLTSTPQRQPTVERLPQQEARLLTQINESLVGIAWDRYHDLVARRHAEALSLDEQQELIALSDQIEAANVQRMTYLIELARLRNRPLDVLIRDLGLKPHD
jgi:hypothetical protein